MKDLEDKIWTTLNGGYKTLFNPVRIIKALEVDPSSSEAWGSIWENLHHQGDIGEASYAIVPYLIDIYQRNKFSDWQIYSFVSLIMVESNRKTNPSLPKWIEADYSKSLSILYEIAIEDLRKAKDELLIRLIIGFITLYKGLIKYGALISGFDELEIEEIIEEDFAWNHLYKK